MLRTGPVEKGQAKNPISLNLEAFIILVKLPLCSVMAMHILPLLNISLVSPEPALGPNRSPRLGLLGLFRQSGAIVGPYLQPPVRWFDRW